ncbi:type I secretion system permease/ATPase [Variovorax defluvii]|uniref:Type I secretion system permease/ATPase n=2 Tax=Variovorax defluvii TaxID=913761 RepID=A0ABP8I0V4_9BURK
MRLPGSLPGSDEAAADDAAIRAPQEVAVPFEICLALCSAVYGRPVSALSLGADLPREEHRLAPAAFERAAERADLRLSAVDAAGADGAVQQGDCLIVPRGLGFTVIRKLPGGVHRLMPPAEGTTAREPLDEAAMAQAIAQGGWAVQPDYLAHAPGTELALQPDRYAWLRRAVASQWHTYAHVALASLVANVLLMLASFYSMQVYDRVVPNNAFETLWALTVGVSLIYLFDLLLRVARAFMIDYAGKRVDLEISSRLFQQVTGLRMAQRPASAGAFANHLNEFESLRDFFTSLSLSAVIDLPFVFIYLAAIAGMGGISVAAVPVLAIVLMLGVTLLLQGPVDRAVKVSMQASAQKHGMLIEVLAGIEAIKLSASESVFQGAWERAVKKIALASMHSKLLSTVGTSLVSFLQSLSGVAVIVVGVYGVAAQQLTMGGLIACSILASRAVAPIGQLAGMLSRWKQTRQSMTTLDQIFRRPVERPAGKSFVVRDALSAAIELRGASFSYAGAPAPVLRNVSFTIQPGERVAVIGRSGSGKSTLAKLIAGLYEVSEGAVLVGGVDTRQLDPQQLRRSIAVVAQDPYLFNGTVRDNIAHGTEAADEARVLEAARAAGVDDFVRTHPLGYDMPVGERGALLSGGQRQAVVLARALIGGGRILLFDEPSNSLDFAGEGSLRARLAERRDGETLILVTHRTSMLDLVDRVIAMDAGRVLADGPPEAVLKNISPREER